MVCVRFRVPLVWMTILTFVFPPSLVVAELNPPRENKTTAYDLPRDPTRPRPFLLPPLFSSILPGLDQVWEGQYGYGSAYLGTALAGYGLSFSTGPLNLDPRFAALGVQTAGTAGSISAFHSFRSAAKSRHAQGQFLFLDNEESPGDLLLAPFRFSYLARPTTFIGLPASILVDYLLFKVFGYDFTIAPTRWPSAADAFFSMGVGLNAGIGEEAFFRGWLMPVAMHYTGSPLVSNSLISLVFGALHYREGYIPITQTIGGFYYGWLTQRDGWRIGEAIFNHVWFDVIVFLIGYSMAGHEAREKVQFRISPIAIRF